MSIATDLVNLGIPPDPAKIIAANSGGGVVGPGSSIPNSIALFSGSTGNIIQDSGSVPSAYTLTLMPQSNSANWRTALGLGNVDNTSDANKPVSTATQTALDLKQNLSAKGQANGYASLDGSGLVPVSQLPPSAIGVTSVAGLTGDVLASPLRTALSLVPGTDIQVQNANLQAISGLTSGANLLAYFTGSGTAATTALTSFARTLLDDADASTSRTTLGLVIGTNVQAYNINLAAIAGLTSSADTFAYFTGSGTASLASLTTQARQLLDDTSFGAMRTTLGLAIGTDVEAYSANLNAIAGLASGADTLPYFTGSGAAALTTLNLLGRNFLNNSSYANMRTTLGVAIGSDVQAYNVNLSALAGLTSAADALPYFTGSGTAAVTTLTTQGRQLLDDTSFANMRTTLGLGTIAVLNSIDLASNVTGRLPFANMGQVATQTITGRNSASTGNMESITITQALDWIGNTRGSVIFRGASAWSPLVPGTSGYVLTSNGAGADPSYVQPTQAASTGQVQAGAATNVYVNPSNILVRPKSLAGKGGVDQTGVPPSTPTLVTFGTEIFDIGSVFSSNAFTAPYSGQFAATIQIVVTSGVTVGSVYNAYLIKNGVTTAGILGSIGTTVGVILGGMLPFDAVSGDIFEVYADFPSLSTTTILGAAGTFFGVIPL